MTDSPSVVLVAHGSLHEPKAFIPALDHAEALRETGSYESVHAGFLHGEPALTDVITAVEGGEVVVVPLFVSEGYYTQSVIPERLDAAARPELSMHYTPPVGTHARMADIVKRRVVSAVGDRRESIGIALVGHGSPETPESANALHQLATTVRTHDRVTCVQSFFLEEPPYVDEIPEAFETAAVVVVPVFMAEGHHVSQDIPAKLGGITESPTRIDGYRLWYTPPVGTDPLIVDIVRDRVRTALPTASEHAERQNHIQS